MRRRKHEGDDDGRQRWRRTQEQNRRRPPLFRRNPALQWSLLSFGLIYYMLATLRLSTLGDCSQERITTTMDRLYHHDASEEDKALAATERMTRDTGALNVRGTIQRDTWRPRDSPLVSFREPFLAPPRIAANASTVVFILSKYDHFAQRQAIRTTWAAPPHSNAYFVIGHPPRICSEDCNSRGVLDVDRSLIEQRLREEQAANSDLVEIPMDETYHTLPEKVIQAYNWIIYHFPSVQWLVKVDDDMYCRIDALEAYLQRYNPQQHILLGDMQVGSEVWRTGKWAEKKYNASEYP